MFLVEYTKNKKSPRARPYGKTRFEIVFFIIFRYANKKILNSLKPKTDFKRIYFENIKLQIFPFQNILHLFSILKKNYSGCRLGPGVYPSITASVRYIESSITYQYSYTLYQNKGSRKKIILLMAGPLRPNPPPPHEINGR